MASRPIIKHLNIIEDFCSRHFAGFEDMASDFLLLQTPEEGLDGRIIITVSPPTHAREQPMQLTKPSPLITTILRSLIRMDNDVLLGLTPSHGHQ